MPKMATQTLSFIFLINDGSCGHSGAVFLYWGAIFFFGPSMADVSIGGIS